MHNQEQPHNPQPSHQWKPRLFWGATTILSAFVGLGAMWHRESQYDATFQSAYDQFTPRQKLAIKNPRFNNTAAAWEELLSINKTFMDLYPEKSFYLMELPPEKRSDFINEAFKPKHAYEILLRHTYKHNDHIEKYELISEVLKEKIAGPWNVDPKHHKLLKSLGENPHLDTLLKCLALESLNSTRLVPPSIVFAPILDNLFADTNGRANMLGDIFIDSYLSEQEALLTFAHEAGHQGQWLANKYTDMEPKNFKGVMEQVFINLHQQLSPGTTAPSDPKELLRELIKKSSGAEEEIFISLKNVFTSYDESKHHAEFVVKATEFIGGFGELPPHIRDPLQPLTDYYKSYITPRWQEIIDNHPSKGMLLEDGLYPETMLSLSGENALFAKDKEKCTSHELELTSQIENIRGLITAGNTEAAKDALDKVADERVARASLTACIEHNQSELFNNALEKIKGKQYLGPQLLLAARGGKKEMVDKLLPHADQYHLAKVVEVAVDNKDVELLKEAVAKIENPWFLTSSFGKGMDQELIQAVAFTSPAEKKFIADKLDNYQFVLSRHSNPGNKKILEYFLDNEAVRNFIDNDLDKLKHALNNYFIFYDDKGKPIEHPISAFLSNEHVRDFIGGDVNKLDFIVQTYKNVENPELTKIISTDTNKLEEQYKLSKEAGTHKHKFTDDFKESSVSHAEKVTTSKKQPETIFRR